VAGRPIFGIGVDQELVEVESGATTSAIFLLPVWAELPSVLILRRFVLPMYVGGLGTGLDHSRRSADARY